MIEINKLPGNLDILTLEIILDNMKIRLIVLQRCIYHVSMKDAMVLHLVRYLLIYRKLSIECLMSF